MQGPGDGASSTIKPKSVELAVDMGLCSVRGGPARSFLGKEPRDLVHHALRLVGREKKLGVG